MLKLIVNVLLTSDKGEVTDNNACLVPIKLVTAEAKFAPLLRALANSFNVSKLAGAAATKLCIDVAA